jgi:hypothetical protein
MVTQDELNEIRERYQVRARDWLALYTSDPDYGEFYSAFPDFDRLVTIMQLKDLAAQASRG